MTLLTSSRTAMIFLTAAIAATGVAAPAKAQQSESLYVGYYQEDPLDNPEDPTLGTLYLQLPTGNGAFAGNMFFTYVGCQTSNVGTITGAKAEQSLQGTWTGITDGTPQNGNFTGKSVSGWDAYAGTYSVAGGKQHIVVADCIQYYVASRGTFELFAAGKSEPASFAVSLHNKAVTWTAPTGAVMTLVAVIDPQLASGGHSNATLWQTLVMGGQHTANIAAVKLVTGHRYLASVGAVDQSFKRISFGSVGFVAQ